MRNVSGLLSAGNDGKREGEWKRIETTKRGRKDEWWTWIFEGVTEGEKTREGKVGEAGEEEDEKGRDGVLGGRRD